MQNIQSVGVIGAGSWGTALAIHLARNGLDVALWGNEPKVTQAMRQSRYNARYLPEIKLPPNLSPVDYILDLANRELILIAVPSHAFRPVLENLKRTLNNVRAIVWASKGFEAPQRLLHQVVEEIYPSGVEYAVLSGPTFALEVARALPTAVTIASPSPEFATRIAHCLHNDHFRAYTSTDVIGVEVGGAVKNILAIGAGIADGLGFGANTRAALITRGLTEIIRLGLALGAETETFMGLTGLGDLVLTCTDNLSRNRRFGIAIAQGQTQAQALKSIGQVVEGIQTAKAVHELAQKLGIEMPITEQVFQVLYEEKAPRDAVSELFLRELKPEYL